MSLLSSGLPSVSREDDRTSHAPSTPDQLLDVKGAAELLNVPESWIYQHVRARAEQRLPHFKLGKYIRFSATALSQWLETCHFNSENSSSAGHGSFPLTRLEPR
jgi:excisionase family DNA binding protein